MSTAPRYLFSATDTDPGTDPATGAADGDTTTNIADPPRFLVHQRAGIVNGGTAYIVVAIDEGQISRISAHLMTSALHATGVAELLNSTDGSEPTTTPASDAADQSASEDARSLVLARIDSEFPPQMRPAAPPAKPLAWRRGVAHTRTAADDTVNTYIVERHSSTNWELCAWNSKTFDDVERLAGTMTPTRELARAIAAEYSALGEKYCAGDHGGTSRATAAIIAAYHHERAQHAAEPPVQVNAA